MIISRLIYIYIYIYIYIQIANVYNSHDNITMRNQHQCWAIRNCFNFFLKVLIDSFLFLSCGGSLCYMSIRLYLYTILIYTRILNEPYNGQTIM